MTVSKPEPRADRHGAVTTTLPRGIPAGGGVALAALAGFAIALAVLYPGQYPFDSAYQLWQARHGAFSNITPVPMIGVWSLLLKAFGSPGSLLCLNLAMFWTGLGLCAHALRAPEWLKVSGLALVGLNPLTLVQMAHLLSDAHMTGAMFLGIGLIARALNGGTRLALISACLLFVYAGTIRQNALVAVVPLGPLALIALRPGKPVGMKLGIVSTMVAGILALIAGTALDRLLATERRELWPMLALWDMAAISVATDQLQLPPFTHGAGLDVNELRDTGAFNPVSVTYLFSNSRSGMNNGFLVPYSAEQRHAIARAWWKAIGDHPLAYLAHRAETTRLLFGKQSGASHGIPYYRARTAYRDNPALPTPWFDSLQQGLYAIADQLQSTWLFSALPYLLIDAAAFALAWTRRRSWQAAIALGMSSSALLYAASFLVLAPSAELRYLTWPIIAALPALGLALSARQIRSSGSETRLPIQPSSV